MAPRSRWRFVVAGLLVPVQLAMLSFIILMPIILNSMLKGAQ
jgi:hypothetical protein